MTVEQKTIHLEAVVKNHGKDMTGKVAVITGTTSGTGFICARELAKQGATVVLLNRESNRSSSSVKSLQEAVPTGVFESIACDLQSFDSVRKASETIKGKFKVVDVLVNNAGVMAMNEPRGKPTGYQCHQNNDSCPE